MNINDLKPASALALRLGVKYRLNCYSLTGIFYKFSQTFGGAPACSRLAGRHAPKAGHRPALHSVADVSILLSAHRTPRRVMELDGIWLLYRRQWRSALWLGLPTVLLFVIGSTPLPEKLVASEERQWAGSSEVGGQGTDYRRRTTAQ